MGRHCAILRSGSSFPAQAGAPSSLLSGLLHHWTMSDAVGDLLDSVDGAPLTRGGEPIQVEGKLGNATQFSPTTQDYAYHASMPSLRLNATDFTLAAWVWLDSVSSMGILGKWSGGSKEYLLSCDGNSLVFSMSSDGSLEVSLSSAVLVEAATWYFFLAWYESAYLLHLSIDMESPEAQLPYTDGVFPGTAPFEMGRDLVSENYFAGRLNSVSLWNRLLTPTERSSLWNLGNGLAYPFS